MKAVEEITEGSGTILVVDDEEMVLEVFVEVLKASGWTVFEANCGEDAIEIYRSNKGKIDLVLLDMVMPDMGGGVTYDRIKGVNPSAKVILSSGHTIDGEAEEILARGCDAFIQKPFRMGELFQSIQRILDKE